MNKKVVLGIIYAIFPILFNVIYFTLGGRRYGASAWISYVFIHISYIALIIAPLFTRRTQSNLIYKFSSVFIAFLYFCVELIIGAIFIFTGFKKISTVIVVQSIPFCLFLFTFLWNILHIEHTANNEQRRINEVSFIKTASSKAKALMDSVSDSVLKNRIEKTYDLIRTSPSKSYPSVKGTESSIIMMLGELGILLNDNNVSEAQNLLVKIHYTMEERNRIVTLSN